ncbi:MAG TPA: DUF1801 domain-containing protein [Thermoplasmata archaeon]|nr:DUF1801 domain-containing protein [Thermoplasmata archaeon]
MPSRPNPEVEEYLASVSPRLRPSIRRLRATIRAAAPGAEEVISYRMPAFRLHGMLVYYAAFRDHCSFFVGSGTVRANFAKELRPFATGKGTLRFSPEHPLPTALVRRIVRARVAENRDRHRKRSERSLRRIAPS